MRVSDIGGLVAPVFCKSLRSFISLVLYEESRVSVEAEVAFTCIISIVLISIGVFIREQQNLMSFHVMLICSICNELVRCALTCFLNKHATTVIAGHVDVRLGRLGPLKYAVTGGQN